MALRASRQAGGEVAERLITVAPAFTRYYQSPAQVPMPACPWLIVQGDADEVIAPQEVIGWAQALQPRPYLVVMPGVGHFFHGRLNELRAALLGWVRSG